MNLRLWFAERARPSDSHLYSLWAIPIGIVGAFATVAFRESIDGIQTVIFGQFGDPAYLAGTISWYARLLVPSLGGVVAGIFLALASRAAPKVVHSEYMEAVTIGNGIIPTTHTILRAASSMCSIASGASIGREGPMVQLAALCASLLGRLRTTNPENLRTIVACGAAAGITAAYNAPVAGAFFVAEIVLGQIVAERMGPLIVASVVANITMRLFPGYRATYLPDHLTLPPVAELALFPVLGLGLGLAAPFYLAFLSAAKRYVGIFAMPAPVSLGMGGLCVGLISLWVPDTWGNGNAVVSALIAHPTPWTVVASILIFKIVATAASSASGAVGGIFTPTIFVGASLGALAASLCTTILPGFADSHSLFVIVGMGAFLAATTHAPLMSILMILEMTLSYEVMLPLVIASVTAYAVSRLITPFAMYSATARVNERRQAVDRARGILVADILKRGEQVLPVGASLAELRNMFLAMPVKYVYLVDTGMRFCGTVALGDFNAVLPRALSMDLSAASIARHDVPTVALSDSGPTVLTAFLKHDGERLPVVSDDGEMRFLGVVSKADFLLSIETLL
ncbi:ClcB-like voltage-gated chloride channel protein [Paraburkholderia sediminicola]|uniref:ClcB-like voltage-gated chloride channel protein n=1 Tax=Paraburkholderia sediminicola TaxID=458836 RepID=UPI0038B86982